MLSVLSTPQVQSLPSESSLELLVIYVYHILHVHVYSSGYVLPRPLSWFAPKGFLPFSKHSTSQLPGFPNPPILPLPRIFSFRGGFEGRRKNKLWLEFACQNLLFFWSLFLRHSGLRGGGNGWVCENHSQRVKALCSDPLEPPCLSLGSQLRHCSPWEEHPLTLRSGGVASPGHILPLSVIALHPANRLCNLKDDGWL